jgi:glutathione S-transferase
MTITITAFERSPDGGKGLARDTRVRWALEEVGQPYEVRLISFRAMKEPAHLALHPFGQIPTYEEGDLALFETGAIVFHVAERLAGLLPDDANARARAITWMFARLTPWSRRSSNSQSPSCWNATRPGTRSACLWSRIVSAAGWTNFPLGWAMLNGSMVRSARAT